MSAPRLGLVLALSLLGGLAGCRKQQTTLYVEVDLSPLGAKVTQLSFSAASGTQKVLSPETRPAAASEAGLNGKQTLRLSQLEAYAGKEVVVSVVALSGQQVVASGSEKKTVILGHEVTVPVKLEKGSAARLSFVVQPRGGVAGKALDPPVAVAALDAQGRPVLPAKQSISLALRSSSSAVLAGTLSAETREGVATFSGLMVKTAGTGFRLEASLGGLTAESDPFDVQPGTAAALAFSSPPRTLLAGACPGATGAIEVALLDASGNQVKAEGGVSFTASSSSFGGSFFLDPACATPAPSGSFSFSQGASTVSLFYLDTEAGTPSVQISTSAGLVEPAAQLQQVNPARPSQLVIVSDAQQVQTGACSGAVTVESKDEYGNASPVTSPTAITLSASLGGTSYYSDPACGNAVSNLTLAAGESQLDFHFKATVTGSLRLTVSASGLTSGSQDQTITAAPSKLAFLGGPRTVTAGSCSPELFLQLQDEYGNVAAAASELPVSLNSTSTSTFFYGGLVCGAISTKTVIIPSGKSQVSFHFKDNLAGRPIITATADGLTFASQQQTVQPGSPSKLRFTTSAQTLSAGTCSAPTTVQLEDALGNPSPVSSATAVALSPAAVSFHASSSCAGALTSPSIPANSSSLTFYWKDITAGSRQLSASSMGLVATQTENVLPGPPAKLAFLNGNLTFSAGLCSGAMNGGGAIQVQVRDAHGNPVIPPSPGLTLTPASSSASAVFYLNASCGTAVPGGGFLLANSSVANLYYRDPMAGRPTVTVSASFDSVQQIHTVDPAPPVRLAFAGAPASVIAGDCNPMAVELRDPFDNPTISPTSVTVSLANADYSQAYCGSLTTQVTIPPGTIGVPVQFRATAAGTRELAGTDVSSNLLPANHPVAVKPGPPSQVRFVSAPQTIVSARCSCAAEVESQDQYGNPSDLPADALCTLNRSRVTAIFSLSPGCDGGFINSLTIPGGGHRARFYFTDQASIVTQLDIEVKPGPIALVGDSQTETVVTPPIEVTPVCSGGGSADFCLPDGGSCTADYAQRVCCGSGSYSCFLQGRSCQNDTDCCSGACCGGLCTARSGACGN